MTTSEYQQHLEHEVDRLDGNEAARWIGTISEALVLAHRRGQASVWPLSHQESRRWPYDAEEAPHGSTHPAQLTPLRDRPASYAHAVTGAQGACRGTGNDRRQRNAMTV